MKFSDISKYRKRDGPGQVIHNQKQKTCTDSIIFSFGSLVNCSTAKGNRDCSACDANGNFTIPTKASYIVIPVVPGSAHLSALNHLCNFRLASPPPWIIMYEVLSR